MNETTTTTTTTPIKGPCHPEEDTTSTAAAAAAAVTATTTAVSTNCTGAMAPTPVRTTTTTKTYTPGTGSSQVSTPGPPTPQQHPHYGWIPGASPPHPYHPYPMHHHHYHHPHHPPPMYGSPDSSWIQRNESNNNHMIAGTMNTGTSNNGDTGSSSIITTGTSGNHLPSPPPPPTMAPYGWPPMGSYPYPPPPPPHAYPNNSSNNNGNNNHTNNNNNRYPPLQPPPHHHHYPWPPPMTLPQPPPPLLHPQQQPPRQAMNSNHRNHATTTKGSGTTTTTTSTTTHRNNINNAAKSNNNSAAQSLNNNNKPSTTMKSKLTIGSGVGTNNDSNDVPLPASYLSMAALQTRQNHLNRTKSRALSPTEIEINHRDEIQHMGCTCKKTRCLKLYCQCFAAKLYCGVNCRCAICFNNRKHEKQRKEAMRNILSRNLSAFDTKFKKDATLVLVEQPVVATTNPMAGTETTSPPLPLPPSSELSKTPDPNHTATTSNAAVVAPTTTTTPDAATTAATLVTSTEVARVLAHRLGCKCRKSACMKKVRRTASHHHVVYSPVPFQLCKYCGSHFFVLSVFQKYCECYAANVKCSASCRCMGCKNLGGSNLGGGNEFHDGSNMPIHHGMDVMSVAAQKAAHQAARQYHRLPPYSMAMNNPAMHNATTMFPYGMVENGRNGIPPQQAYRHPPSSSMPNHWNDPLSAAESLTFLKHGSPTKSTAATHKSNRPYAMGVSPITKSPGTSAVLENGSIPSLASSSEGDSPRDAGLNHHLQVMSTPESYRGEDSALLIAAMAMTEFGQSPPPTTSMLSPDTIRTYRTDNGEDDDDDERISVNPSDMDDDKLTPLPSNASKRSINFDDLVPDSNSVKNSKKKSKPNRWMS